MAHFEEIVTGNPSHDGWPYSEAVRAGDFIFVAGVAAEDETTGQIIGENSKEGDVLVNAQRTKKLTNMRAAGSDRNLKLAPAVKMSLEECLEYLNPDELVEITPQSIRLRKTLLDENDRKRAAKPAAEPAA